MQPLRFSWCAVDAVRRRLKPWERFADTLRTTATSVIEKSKPFSEVLRIQMDERQALATTIVTVSCRQYRKPGLARFTVRNFFLRDW